MSGPNQRLHGWGCRCDACSVDRTSRWLGLLLVVLALAILVAFAMPAIAFAQWVLR